MAKKRSSLGKQELVDAAAQFTVESFDEADQPLGYDVPDGLSGIDIRAEDNVDASFIAESLQKMPLEVFNGEGEHADQYVSTLEYRQQKPMTLQEAVDEKFKRGLEVFVFTDKDTNKTHVLYSNSDESLGLVVPS